MGAIVIDPDLLRFLCSFGRSPDDKMQVPPSVEPISKAVGSDYSYNLRLIRSGEISSLFYKLFGKNVFGPVNFQMGLLFGLILFSTFLLIGYIYNKTNDN